MSPRSAELASAARRRLLTARAALPADTSGAVSAAYYAMLYAARAALSESDVYARTHKGTWHELRRVFVESGRLDQDLVSRAQRVQSEREDADYEAWNFPAAEADRVIALAEEFLAAIEGLIA